MIVTLLGMVMEVRSLHPPKAERPILLTLLGMTVFLHPAISLLLDVSIMALQLFRELYFVFPPSTFIEVRAEQP